MLDFQQDQRDFAAYIRDPSIHPLPHAIELRRMEIYRNLFYNNVEGFWASNFPVLRQIIPDTQWHDMVQDFFSHHHSRTPLFPELGQELLQYLREEREPQPEDPPFLAELAHYEWLELLMLIAEGERPTDLDPNGDLLIGCPVATPFLTLAGYNFPVHQIGPDYQPRTAPETPTLLAVYRDREDVVQFLAPNPVTYRLLERLQTAPTLTGQAHCLALAAEMQHPHPEIVVQGGAQILAELQALGVVLGARHS
jgi:hypothetical protein